MLTDFVFLCPPPPHPSPTKKRLASYEEVKKRGYVMCANVRMWYELDHAGVLYIYRANKVYVYTNSSKLALSLLACMYYAVN